MKRIALMLAIAATLCQSAGRVQAHEHHHHGHGAYYGYYGGYYGRVYARPVPWAVPTVVMPAPRYRSNYGYGCDYSSVPYGVYYRGPRVSVSIGF